ncbi:unnamed protein product [Arabidopsis thaliana]|uniref:F-box associated beta-propeller type 1 domain-containing protein n=3 Tax=Arabidopsis TaxID=3701 RepID=A0A654F7M4_ARATH|nr:F-box associated ubiquitination effector protein [Arabidopsis thaliana]AEE75763.1 F-box associated ubiquitination effector protein [Arabidopsis thaliana]KAG7631425.1 F-box associated domain type 1 [Arabidopsis suecica]VYS57537.1 unnamed protein product [Arabidopsis thaliana]|eukprot:NP_188223.1 F-box associated ubiquitination effector protein [Arabidopsis thaliana]
MRALLRIALLKYIHQQLEEKGDLQAIVLLKYSLYSMSVNIHGLHNDFAPSITSRDTVTLSSVREEQLEVLFQNCHTLEMEIWVTTNIEPNAMSWSKFL